MAARVADQHWYHTIPLRDGVVTPGFFDTRTAAGRVPLPESLAGLRCLDIGSADGFWAFEMERRGASEVVAVDVADPGEQDWPLPGTAGRGPRHRARPARVRDGEPGTRLVGTASGAVGLRALPRAARAV